ncbi:HIT family protein [Candidatus Woesearchaeota archaeon]|nr:HIT family protein [Candidatus Woesearchaeota archaeon]
MYMRSCTFCNIDPKTNKTLIKEYNHWHLLINYMQPTLGSSLIVLRGRHIERVSELKRDEHLEYLKIVKELERALKESFQPDKINHLMLAMVEPHVHYHVVPRYAEERNFAGYNWIDREFGGMPKMSVETRERPVLTDIIDQLRKYLN